MPAEPPSPLIWSVTMTGYDPGEVREVRHAATATGRQWGLNEDVLYDLGVVVSEMATNAFFHVEGSTTIRMGLDDGGKRLYLEVEDSCPYIPVAVPADKLSLEATDGRGMALVAALTDGCGAYRAGLGKVQWWEMSLPPCSAPLDGPGGPGGVPSVFP